MLSGTRLAREAYWQARRALRILPDDRHETLASLRALLRRGDESGGGLFRFSWGDVEFTKRRALVTQFDDIFIARQYAFACRDAAPVIVDCGGNIGLSAIWFKQSYPRCRLIVYEADPTLCDVLRRNLQRANVTDAAVHNEAVWTEGGSVRFDGAGDDTGRVDPAGSLTVPAVDLAQALPERVDLLKLDVEGAEFTVLNHLCRTGALSRVRRMVCEFHVTRERTGDFLSTLCALRDAGMELSLTAGLGDWTGEAATASPFEFVGRNNVFAIVYAWNGAACTSPS